jgi:hypothetical protein
MDPATLALAVAPLVAKAAQTFGEGLWDKFADTAAETAGERAADAGWGALGRLAVRMRAWFADHGDGAGAKALDAVVDLPDSNKAVERLADALQGPLASDPEFAADLTGLFEQAMRAGGEVQQLSVQVRDSAVVGKILQIETLNAQGGTLNF